MNLQLKGKNAIVTGGSKGIGRSIALNLAGEGVNLAICARGKDALKKTEKDLLKKGVKVIALACDVGNTKQLDAFFEQVKDQFKTASRIFSRSVFPGMKSNGMEGNVLKGVGSYKYNSTKPVGSFCEI